ncbi:hypothetical protein [Flavobacterium sp.]
MTFEQIKEKVQYGDYNVLQHLINAPTVAAARARFLRGDDNAIEAMKQIQQNREKLIENFKSEQKI